MIYLITGFPQAKHAGDRMIASFPSGKDTLELALTYHEALNFAAVVVACANKGMREANIAAEPTAQIVAFPRR